MNAKIKALCVVGARPNFMKMAPAIKALELDPDVNAVLVHTGQHYDSSMSDTFIQQLGIREPAYKLKVGSGSHAVQTARIIERIEPVFIRESPDILIVAGDVNSTLAAAVVASKLNVPVAHIEAGLRSFDRRMPEEINRIIVDRITDVFYITEESARTNLLREGVDEAHIVFVGNLMIDTLKASLINAIPTVNQLVEAFGESTAPDIERGYALLTLHRPSNVDQPDVLRELLGAIMEIASEIPILFPVHPRTSQRIADLGLEFRGMYKMPPVGYLEMLGLMSEAKFVLTDSGGIQEETTALGIPCLTLRENTERPITVEQGTNTVVGIAAEKIIISARAILSGQGKVGRVPRGWDGHAAGRLASHMIPWLRNHIERQREETV